MKRWMGLFALFTFFLVIRLTLAFSTPAFSTPDAYVAVRALQLISQGTLVDPLIGQTIVAPFDILLYLFTFGNSTALKIIPNIFASFLIFPVFFLTQRITNNTLYSFLATTLASIAFIPTFNTLTALTLAVPLLFTLILLWIDIPSRPLLICTLILLLALIHPLSLLFAFALAVMFIIFFAEKVQPHPEEYELGLFAFFFIIWIHFLLYKHIILVQGLPHHPLRELQTLIENPFLIAGASYALYLFFKQTNHNAAIFLGLAIAPLLALLFGLAPIETVLSFLAIYLIILSAKAIAAFAEKLRQTRTARFTPLVIIFLIAGTFAITTTTTSFRTQTILASTLDEPALEALAWIHDNIPATEPVVAPAEFGPYLLAIAQREPIIEELYPQEPTFDQKLADVTRLYKTNLETEAVSIFDKYGALYILVPPLATIHFTSSPCFSLVYNTTIRIYSKDPSCKLQVVA